MQPKDIKNDKISDKLLQNDIYTASSELKKSAIQIRDSNKQKKMTLPLSQIRKQRAVNNSFNNRRLKTIVKNMAAHGTTITPVDPVYKQINHRRNPVNFPKPNRNSFTSNLTDDMFVLESPSFVVPLLYMKDPKTSLRNFLAEYEKISLEESYEVTKKRISISSDESWLKELSSESEGEIDNVTEKNLIINNKKNTFFSSSIGNFFTDIGLDCVMSYIQNDLKIAANGKKTLMSSKMFNQNTNNINDLYNFPLKSCHLCNFKTESSIVLNDHMFSLHLNVKNVYHCTFCSFTTPKYMIIVMHLRSSHHIQPRIEPPVFQYLCPLCSFEDNVKSRYNRHISACAKRYNHMENLSPPNEWIPPAKMGLVDKTGDYIPKPVSTFRSVAVQYPNNVSTNSVSKIQGTTFQKLQMKDNDYKSTVLKKPLAQQIIPFIVCEICDGYLRHFNDYKTHLLLVHQVEAKTPKPPLDCTKCIERFHTEKGLLRHYLGHHGMITREFLDAEKEGKDCGKCLLCHKVFDKKYVDHMRRIHKLTLKIFGLSFRCILCSTQFNDYNTFSSHAHTTHNIPKDREIYK